MATPRSVGEPMRELRRRIRWVPCLLAFVVLAANVGSPFRGLGPRRASLPRGAAAGHDRARLATPTGAALGFRAVTGVVEDDSDETAVRDDRQTPFLHVPPACCRVSWFPGRVQARFAPLSPPLRC